MSVIFDNTSPSYFVRHWRAVPVEIENTFEDFLAWLDFDADNMEEADINMIKALVNQYLGRDMSKVKQGEKEMLAKWKGTKS